MLSIQDQPPICIHLVMLPAGHGAHEPSLPRTNIPAGPEDASYHWCMERAGGMRSHPYLSRDARTLPELRSMAQRGRLPGGGWGLPLMKASTSEWIVLTQVCDLLYMSLENHRVVSSCHSSEISGDLLLCPSCTCLAAGGTRGAWRVCSSCTAACIVHRA